MTLQVDDEIQQYIDKKLTHQGHNSERRAFRACRRRWNWIYRDMYNPMVPSMPLDFGVAFHVAMETFYEPRTWTADNEVRTDLALVAFKRTADAQLKKYKKQHPDPDIEVLNGYKEHQELGLNMIKYYCGRVSPVYDRNWKPIEVEVSFEVPIKDPETGLQLWCKCESCRRRWIKAGYPEPNSDWKGLPVTYGGRLDALFEDTQGRYWIVDWKTTSRMLDEDKESSFLQLDDQVVGYMWSLEQYGIHCAGFVYVEIRKTFPQPPERLQRIYKGKAFSTNKANWTTAELFERTVMREDNDAWQMGIYDDHIRWLNSEGPKFTMRHQIHKNKHEIEEAGKVIAYEMMDITSNPRIYPQAGRFACTWCLFQTPCLGKNMGEDYQYTLDTLFEKRTMMYWEEKEASTE